MSDIDDLKVKRGQVLDKMENMRQSITGKDWTPENTAEFDKLSNEFDELDSKINRLNSLEEMGERIKEQQAENASRPGVGSNQPSSRFGSEDYENNFRNHVLSRGREFRNDLEAGVDAEGGFVVAESWERELLAYLEDEVVMRRLATVRTYSVDTNIPISDDNSTAAWVDEEGTIPTNDTSFSNVKMQAYKLANILKASEELLKDSFLNLRLEIAAMFGRTFGTSEEAAFTVGDGSGKPTGVIPSAAAGVTAASVSAITMDELVDLLTSVRDVYARRGTFMMNRTTAAIVRKLKDSNGAYLWQPSTQAGQPELLLGKPMAINEQMVNPAAGTKPVSFGDMKYYRIADRLGITLQVLNELYAVNGQVGFKFQKRTDGKLLRSEAVKVITMAAS